MKLTEEDRKYLAAWDADAYRITVEVPTSKLTTEQIDDLFGRIAEVTDEWMDSIPDRDWDPAVHGTGPTHRPPVR